MDTSLFLARLIGPMLVVLAIGLLARQDSWRAMANDFVTSRPLLFLSGFLTLLGGLAVVNTHNVWEGGWPVIITIFGWLARRSAALRACCSRKPSSASAQEMLKEKTCLTVGGAASKACSACGCATWAIWPEALPTCVRRRGGAHYRRSEGRRR